MCGLGSNAPVLFSPGAIGNGTPLRVAPETLVLLRSARAQLLFAAHEVLVSAHHLVNGADVRFDACPWVTYAELWLPGSHLVLLEGGACAGATPDGARQDKHPKPVLDAREAAVLIRSMREKQIAVDVQ